MERLYFYSRTFCALLLTAAVSTLHAQGAKPFDAAAAFGARTDITSLRLSPDGTSVVFVTPIQGQGSVVYTVALAPGAKPKVAFYTDGKPFRLQGCNWVANDRLVCSVFGVVVNRTNTLAGGFLAVQRLWSVNADGSKPQQLTTEQNSYVSAFAQSDSAVIDWLPDQDGSILMERVYLPEVRPFGTMTAVNDKTGVGVDLVDTRTMAIKHVIPARQFAIQYLSDGRGTVRIVGEANPQPGQYGRPEITYLYRMQGSDDWHDLSTYNETDHTGFQPIAVDHDLNLAYGWKKLDGRIALYTMSLDGMRHEELVFSRPDVDLEGLARIGRRNRVVGVSYSTALSATHYLADDMKQLLEALHKAIQQPLVEIVDSSVDENTLLVFAGSDTDPGAYYILDRKAHSLHRFLGTRAKLEGVQLGHVKPITYPAADGTQIPAYLTLPPGVDTPHGLPAIVMPHGGPSARDRWGFDWLAQFFAARGYVVLQPEFRGSAGYGDAWFQNNGFKSWDVAIGDVVAAGRWLVSDGIADPAKLGIVGWSYGGYAALQSVDVDPTLFKAVVAIAPVTDLATLKSEHSFFGDYFQVSDFIGSGDHMREGSPITHADKFKQPVLLFHGTQDRNVSIEQSKRMAAALKAAGAQCDLVIFEDRDHNLEDSQNRADMLHQSDAFLRRAFGMSP